MSEIPEDFRAVVEAAVERGIEAMFQADPTLVMVERDTMIAVFQAGYTTGVNAMYEGIKRV
jgi:hypothetical protein